MSVQDAPILGLLRDTLGYLTQRQKVLAQNVANANTPGYVPKDISEGAFEQALARQARRTGGGSGLMTTTSDRHFASPTARSRDSLNMRAVASPDSETTVDGNAVVLEEQMSRVVDTQMRYETVVGLYQKSLNLVRLAARPPR